MWVSESDDPTRTRQVLVMTGYSFYWVQTGNWADIASEEGKEGGVHEEFAKILSYDVESGHITLGLEWVRNDSRFGGFDMPMRMLTYEIGGDAIRFSVAGEGDFPAVADSEPYFRQ
jgi:hypothetical protein